MQLTEVEIQRRKPLWTALSDLFLDTELQDNALSQIADKMRESGYTLKEIERILMEEVFPLLIDNLVPTGGEWTGFDQVWLHETILKSKPPGPIGKTINRIRFYMIQSDWKTVTQKFESSTV